MTLARNYLVVAVLAIAAGCSGGAPGILAPTSADATSEFRATPSDSSATKCPTNVGLASPPSFTSTPQPTYTSPPRHLVSFNSMSALSGQPGEIACDAATGNIYGSLPTSGDYFAFSPDLRSATEISNGTGTVTTIIADADGVLYAGASGGKLGVDDLFSGTAGGSLAAISLGANGTSVTAIASGLHGAAYVAGSLNGSPVVYDVSEAGSVTTYAAPSSCTGFAAATSDASGNLYLADAGCGVQKLSPSGKGGGLVYSTLASISIDDQVTQLIIGPDRALYYPSESNRGFIRVNVSNGATTAYPLPIVADHVESLAAGPHGRLWFSADQFQKTGGNTGGVVGSWNLATGKLYMYVTSVTGNTPGGLGVTDPLYLIPGPNGALYGTTQTAQQNMIVITP